MRIKGLFWILTALLLSVLAIITYHAFYAESSFMFFFVEGIVILTIIYLFVFYSRIIKPLTIIGNNRQYRQQQCSQYPKPSFYSYQSGGPVPPS